MDDSVLAAFEGLSALLDDWADGAVVAVSGAAVVLVDADVAGGVLRVTVTDLVVHDLRDKHAPIERPA